MATIVLRQTKGAPLTNQEVDANFTNLNNDIQTRVLSSDFNATNLLNMIKTVDGLGSGLDADSVDGLHIYSGLPPGPDYSSIVTRDAAGNSQFNQLTLTSTLTGVNANFSGTVSVGSISIAGGSIPITVGGTGATNATNARANLGLTIGSQVQAWSSKLDALSSPTYAADTIGYFTGASTASSTSLTAYARTLIAAADAASARTVLGTRIGTDVQPYNTLLSAISSLATNGLISRGSASASTAVTITGVASEIVVTNGDGVAGNPTLGVGTNIPKLSASNTFSGTTNAFVNITASSYQTTSDISIKSDIKTLTHAVDIVNHLRGVAYVKDNKAEIGLIAQEVEVVLPQVVGETPEGLKTVAYSNIVGLLIEAIKEQQQTINDLTTRLEKLEN